MARHVSRCLVVALVLSLVSVGLLQAPASASGVPYYSLTVLPIPDGAGGWLLGAGGVDDAGDVVGNAADTGNSQHVLVWPHGANTVIQPAPNGLPAGLTHDGVFLYWNNGDGREHQYVIASGTDSVLKSVLNNVNAMNVGNPRTTVGSYTSGGAVPSAGKAPLGSNNINQITDLGFGGGTSGANAINDVGDIVGAGACSVSSNCAYVYDHLTGTATVIGPSEAGIGNTMQATGINQAGEVIGQFWSNGGYNTAPFIYTKTSGLVMLGTGTSSHGSAGGINNAGDVVGEVDGMGAVIWPSGSTIPTNLNSRTVSGSLTGWHLDWAGGINDQGMISASGMLNGQHRAFLLTPVADGIPPTSSGTVVDGSGGAVSANAAGWFNAGSLKLRIQVADDVDGLGLGSLTLNASGATPASYWWRLSGMSTTVDALTLKEGVTSGSYFATDMVGNEETPHHDFTVKYDKTPPLAGCAAAPTGWHKGDVHLLCNPTDTTSGVVSPGSSFTLSTSVGPNQEDGNASTNAQEVCDAAGNCITAQVTGLQIDNAAPAITCDQPDADWHATDVSVDCTAGDGGSGLENAADAHFTLSTNVAEGTETSDAATNQHEVCDAVGNCASIQLSGLKVDRKGPTITVTTPANDRYTIGQVVNADYGCADDGSGLASCDGTVPSEQPVDTATAGAKTFTVDAADNVGNQSTLSVTYDVAYNVCLQYDPSKPSKSGSTIPVKLSLCDQQGNDLSNDALVLHAVAVQAAGGAQSAANDAGNANPNQAFRFDPTIGPSGGFIYNLKTNGLTPGSYNLIFQVGSDATTYVAPFTIR